MMSKVHFLAAAVLASSLAACSSSEQATHEDANAKKMQADNTAMNARDRNDATLTPTDQGGSEADMALTRTVRQAVNADETLSMNAKNVKIISLNGVVTLRGPVDNEDEKARVASLAQTVAGVSRVDNQLEVAAKAASY